MKCLSLTLLQLAVVSVFAAPWSQSGGNAQHTAALETPLGPLPLHCLWEQPTALVSFPNSPPVPLVLAEGLVFQQGGSRDRIEAYHLTSGLKAWELQLDPMASSAHLAYHDGRLCGLSGYGSGFESWCVEANSGELLWRVLNNGFFDRAFTPAIDRRGFLAGNQLYAADGEITQSLEWFDPLAGVALTESGVYGAGESQWYVYGALGGAPVETIAIPLPERRPFDWPTIAPPVVDEEGQLGVHVSPGSQLSVIDLERKAITWQRSGLFASRCAVDADAVYGLQDRFVYRYDRETGALLHRYQGNTGSLEDLIVFPRVVVASSGNETFLFDKADESILQVLPRGGALAFADGFLAVAGGDDPQLSVYASPALTLLDLPKQIDAFAGVPLDLLLPWVSSARAEDVRLTSGPDWLEIVDQTAEGIRLGGTPSSGDSGQTAFILEVDGVAIPSTIQRYRSPEPVVWRQSGDRKVFVGESVKLRVAAQGVPPFRYAWRKAGELLPGETGQTLTLPEVSEEIGGAYTVTISNLYGESVSKPMSVNVSEPELEVSHAERRHGFFPGILPADPLEQRWEHEMGAVTWQEFANEQTYFRVASRLKTPGFFLVANDLFSGRERWRVLLSEAPESLIQVDSPWHDDSFAYIPTSSLADERWLLQRIDLTTGVITHSQSGSGSLRSVIGLGEMLVAQQVDADNQAKFLSFDLNALEPLVDDGPVVSRYENVSDWSTDGSFLYTYEPGRFFAIDPLTGMRSWEVVLPFEDTFLTLSRSLSTPAVEADLAIAGGEEFVAAIDLIERRVLWRAPLSVGDDHFSLHLPYLAIASGNKVDLLDAFSGTVLETFPAPQTLEGDPDNVRSLLLSPDRLYIGSFSMTNEWDLLSREVVRSIPVGEMVVSNGVIVGHGRALSSLSRPDLVTLPASTAVAGTRFEALLSPMTEVEAGSLALVSGPPWMRFVDHDGETSLTGTPPMGVSGEFDIALRGVTQDGSAFLNVSTIAVYLPEAPVVSVAASASRVAVGGVVTLTASFTGQRPVEIQWLKDGEVILGAEQDVLQLQDVPSTASGSYAAQVTNAVGATTSDPVMITVTAANQYWSRDSADSGRNAYLPIRLADATFEESISFELANYPARVALGWGNVYYMDFDQNGRTTALAKSVESGQILWEQDLGFVGTQRGSGLHRDGNSLLTVTWSDEGPSLTSLSRELGAREWRVPLSTQTLRGEIQRFPLYFAGNGVFVFEGLLDRADQEAVPSLTKIDTITGATLLKIPLERETFDLNVVTDGTVLYLGLSDGRLSAHRADDGTQIWQTAPSPGNEGFPTTQIALSGNTLVAVLSDGIEAFDTSTGRLRWRRDGLRLGFEDYAIGNGFLHLRNLERVRLEDGTSDTWPPIGGSPRESAFLTQDAYFHPAWNEASQSYPLTRFATDTGADDRPFGLASEQVIEAVDGGTVLTSRFTETGLLEYAVYVRSDRRRAVEVPPSIAYPGIAFAYETTFQEADGSIIAATSTLVEEGPDWLRSTAPGSVSGTPTNVPDTAQEVILAHRMADGSLLTQSFRLEFEDPHPTILSAPEVLEFYPGQHFLAIIRAEGAPDLRYELRRSGETIASSDGPELNGPAMGINDLGSYELAVVNAVGTAVQPLEVFVNDGYRFREGTTGISTSGIISQDHHQWTRAMDMSGRLESTLAPDHVIVTWTEQARVVSYATSDGSIAWERDFPGEQIRPAVYADGRVFVSHAASPDSHTLSAYALGTGEVLWELTPEPTSNFPFPSYPSFSNDLLYLQVFSTLTHHITRVNPETGGIVDSQPLEVTVPTFFDIPALRGRFLIGDWGENERCFDLQTGEIRWERPRLTSAGPPSLHQGVAFFPRQALALDDGSTVWESGVVLVDSMVVGADLYGTRASQLQRINWLTGETLMESEDSVWRGPIRAFGDHLLVSHVFKNSVSVVDRFSLEEIGALHTEGQPGQVVTDGARVVLLGGDKIRLFDLEGVNSPPQFPGIETLTVIQGEPFSQEITLNDNGPLEEITLGSQSGFHEWLTIEKRGPGVFLLSAEANQVSEEAHLVASDGMGAESYLTLTVDREARNQAPRIDDPFPSIVLDEDWSRWERRFLKHTIVSDRDNDPRTLTLSIESIDRPDLAEVSLEEAALDDVILSVTPARNANGKVFVTYRVTDEEGAFAESMMEIMINSIPDWPRSTGLLVTAREDGAPQTISLGELFTDGDGDVLSYALGPLDSPIIQAADRDSDSLTVTYTPYLSGSTTFPVTATDESGRSAEVMLTLTLPELPDPSIEILAPSLSRQTGLIEQQVRVTNVGPRAIGGFEIVPEALPPGMVLRSPLSYLNPVAPNETLVLTLEWYSPTRSLPDAWQATAQNRLPQSSLALEEDVFQIDKLVRRQDGRVIIEFSSKVGQHYEVHVSEDGSQWTPAGAPFTSGGTRTQWIDQGPPKTNSPPSEASMRLYRVRAVDNQPTAE